ncbi:MBL fold metallo-hydrolase [Anaerocolumna aminovalerica]|uniref:MBL fold metallo-hydrolase n=1 Tax=Anaerocolumna aminovalerica TaxID=1527 RepID=UPI00248B9C9E|nr:MBL fold metallo-hydrolase [Anaerocolumna aminovalerica]
MEQVIVLGTGNAQALNCYNTCFALKEGNEYLLVDTGGGNGILKQLNNQNIPLNQIHHIFITHEHTDHILGIPWMIRFIGALMNQNKYDGNLYVYCHSDLVNTIRTIVELIVQKKFYKFDDRMFLVPLEDGDTKEILGNQITFFDIKSTKAKQYGFSLIQPNGDKITFTGDEPYRDAIQEYVKESTWLFHEAFCLYSQRKIFKPYVKYHSTVKDACQLAEELKIPNLLLWHTEDKNILSRKTLYMEEGKQYYSGNLFIPNDGEIINLINQ